MRTSAVYETAPIETELLVLGAGVASLRAAIALSERRHVLMLALARKQSRGAHYRADFPAHDNKRFLKHSLVRADTIRFELNARLKLCFS